MINFSVLYPFVFWLLDNYVDKYRDKSPKTVLFEKDKQYYNSLRLVPLCNDTNKKW